MKPGTEVLAAELDGGKPRLRLDILNASSRVSVSWKFNKADYNYFWAFFRTTLVRGSLPFELDLVMEGSGMQERTVQFVPGTVQLGQKDGDVHVINADLYVDPISADASADNAVVDAYNARFGL